MTRFFHLFCILLLLLFGQKAVAQQTNPGNSASVKGLLRDTVHNYTVKSATVSIYRSDSTLLNYQLSNNYGEFIFRNLPNGNFYIEISHVSYQLFRRGFSTIGANTLDLKTLILRPKEVSLKQVIVRIPPVQMNGDTLEFNPAAFKLDSNAVVEDLLRKIPNVTIWGDGQITVNGREVKSLLVNGKQFFGSDFKIATQNIPKNVVEKVQVYKERNESNPLDSTLTMNLKLKKSKNKGHFGKIGGGYGSRERFEADANLNMFGPKLQLGIIAAGNNTNKQAGNVHALIANSTFKGTGIRVDYQPNFRVSGINRSYTGGAVFNYNFVENPTQQNRNVLKANYFLQNLNNKLITRNETTTTTGGGTVIFDNFFTTNNTVKDDHKLDSEYELEKPNHKLKVSQTLSLKSGETLSNSFRTSERQQNDTVSTNTASGRNRFSNKDFSLDADYGYSRSGVRKSRFSGFGIRYNLTVSDKGSERTNVSQFRSFQNLTNNRDFNRRYSTKSSTIEQRFVFSPPDLVYLIFGKRMPWGLGFGIRNELALHNGMEDDLVADFAPNSGYVANTYLSNSSRLNVITESPSLGLNKSFIRMLSNRFNRSWRFSINAKQQLTVQNNNSQKSFQDINRRYSKFLPSASITYNRNQFGEYFKDLSLTLNTFIGIPTVRQLAPLTDSSQVYNLYRGNLNLREETTRKLDANFRHQGQRKNPLSYSINASLSFTSNALSDSIFIDPQNRRTIYLSNADGYTAADIRAEIRKALKLQASALQFNLSGSSNISKEPGYLNGTFFFSNTLWTRSNLTVHYTYKDKVEIEAREGYGYHRSRQNAFNTSYGGTNIETFFSGGYKLRKNFSLSSNISLNNSKPFRGSAINYNIWNAGATYRFLKGNNAELTLTALDLLRQNNSVVNYAGVNSFTFGTRNVLQQYFMTTFAYYPRQFGKKSGTK